MTVTLAQMMDEVQINLSGYTFQQDRSTYLTAAVTTLTSPSSAPTVLSLGSTTDFGKGVIEIDDVLSFLEIVLRRLLTILSMQLGLVSMLQSRLPLHITQQLLPMNLRI